MKVSLAAGILTLALVVGVEAKRWSTSGYLVEWGNYTCLCDTKDGDAAANSAMQGPKCKCQANGSCSLQYDDFEHCCNSAGGTYTPPNEPGPW
ncbi:uncharacterized protein PSFLO_01033 [Pseudozyma flocculosa]|uniref:Uncharacterized protein n=1 Tax=Pseudozyma flocculosa TaxID=84751 RepID=A0A5C3EU54_9BASI|nr:uncharacterized protein PSFLO_01033 [Pseudozyma flocculosa]